MREYFELTRGGFILYKTTFTSQGAGLDEKFEVIEFRLSDLYREQFIEINDEKLEMSQWGKPGQRIRMEVLSVRELLTFLYR